jgi:putative radical SAM enzyme (TIGR03279 family)
MMDNSETYNQTHGANNEATSADTVASAIASETATPADDAVDVVTAANSNLASCETANSVRDEPPGLAAGSSVDLAFDASASIDTALDAAIPEAPYALTGVQGSQNALTTDGALVAAVEPGSAADVAGIAAGDTILAVDGEPVRDLIDWRWLTSDDLFDVDFVDAAGEEWETTIEREPGGDIGITFAALIFDKVKTCRNACTFCFMRQLAPDMRKTLVLRDDDWRLSFLTGTFVTLTNLRDDDFNRIVEQGISPLRVSLHASEPDVRTHLIGRHAQHGIAQLDRLLDAGIEVDAQIVLVPGVNDGKHLRATLEWAYARPGITNLGIVPLGFTRFQTDFTCSFNDAADARAVLREVEPFQTRALAERGTPWVFCADEFYRSAWGEALLDHLPQADFYGDFDLFEDGIGIIRANVDEFVECAKHVEGEPSQLENLASVLQDVGVQAYYICGESMQPYFSQLLEGSAAAGYFRALTVKNDFFGGNVDVTGLLCAQDIVKAIKAVLANLPDKSSPSPIFFVPDVCFNDGGVTLDDATIQDIAAATGACVQTAPSNPAAYIPRIAAIARSLHYTLYV